MGLQNTQISINSEIADMGHLEPTCTNIGNRSADWFLIDLVMDNNGNTIDSNEFVSNYEPEEDDVHLGEYIDVFLAHPLSQTSSVFSDAYQSSFDITYNAENAGVWTFDL